MRKREMRTEVSGGRRKEERGRQRNSGREKEVIARKKMTCMSF